ncbi:MAG TPA: hypothetical protein VJJ52_04380 [Candidatus Nanoarchaeia archaeon]|nr:hypothetical protein [Candidatus Nanoarchaeia archaeon]
MDRAIIIVGAEGSGETYTEHYGLVVGTQFVSTSYQGTREGHPQFLNNVADDFVENISAHPSPLEVGVLNGFKLDRNHRLVRIGNPDSETIQSLSQRISQKVIDLSERRALVILVAPN